MSLLGPRKADFSASIFRRGEKQELFGDEAEHRQNEEAELTSKLGDLADLWAAERIGWVFFGV